MDGLNRGQYALGVRSYDKLLLLLFLFFLFFRDRDRGIEIHGKGPRYSLLLLLFSLRYSTITTLRYSTICD